MYCVSDADLTAKSFAAQAVLVEALSEWLAIFHRYHCFRLFVFRAPDLLVYHDLLIPEINVSFVAVELTQATRLPAFPEIIAPRRIAKRYCCN